MRLFSSRRPTGRKSTQNRRRGRRRSRTLRLESLETRTVLSGIVTAAVGGYWDMALDSALVEKDGEVDMVLVGQAQAAGQDADFAVLRFDSNGLPDSSFGSNGAVTTAIERSYSDGASAVAVSQDGRILAVGTAGASTGQDVALARYNENGSLDKTLGKKGKATADLGGNERIEDVLLQADGSIVTAGSTNSSGSYRFAVTQFTPAGKLDGGFGSGGVVQAAIGDNYDEARAVVMHQGQILVVGESNSAATGSDFALVRYDASGNLDVSFSGDGIVVTDFSQDDQADAAAIDQAGNIVVVGNVMTPDGSGAYDLAVVRYTPDGELDTTFGGGDGLVLTDVLGYERAHAVAIQPDGKIVVAGFADYSDKQFALLRYNPNGTLDTTFGNGGITTTAIGSNAEAESVLIQPDGKIVVSGWADTDSGRVIAMARYNADGQLDQTFGVRANRDPVAGEDSATTTEGQPVTIDVLANDSDPDGDTLTVANVSTAAKGTTVVNGDGTITYTPDVDFTGIDSFTYMAKDIHEAYSNEATVTITVDPVNLPQISITDVSKREGRSPKTTTFTFTVTRSGDTSRTTTINYTTVDVGSATGGDDNTAGVDYLTTSGTLTFLPGETTKTISVTVIGDRDREDDEIFQVLLTDEFGNEITGTGTIINDDK